MFSIKKKDWIEIMIHLAFWVGVFYTIRTLGTSFVKLRVHDNSRIMQMDAKETLSPNTWLTLIFLMGLFYGNIFVVFTKALLYRKMISRLAAAIGWFALVFATHYFIMGMLFKAHSESPGFAYNDPRRITDEQFMNDHHGSNSWLHLQPLLLIIFAAVMGLSVAYFFLKEWARNELVRTQLAASQYSTEIKFLKSQINPHFLFNTLNNLFSMAQKKGNDELADGISKLSGMMRYMIYESNEETVPLKKEIEYLQNYIQLNKLRYADAEAKVIFHYPHDTEDIYIAPMLFIPFVENAFKHGVMIGELSVIDISIALVDKKVIFQCQNQVYHTLKMNNEPGGIGLDNVRRRLELVYPQRHELTIKKESGGYCIKLKIDPA